jgi:hypothetical protein
MIEEFAETLQRIDDKIDGVEPAQAGELLDKAFLDLTGAGAEAVSRLSEDDLMARLTLDGPTHTVRIKAAMLVALLQQAGEAHAIAERDAEAEACWLKALNLLLVLQMQDLDFETLRTHRRLRQIRGCALLAARRGAGQRCPENRGPCVLRSHAAPKRCRP